MKSTNSTKWDTLNRWKFTCLAFDNLRFGTKAAYIYELIRTWTASDSCGNGVTATQVVSVVEQGASTLPPVMPDFSAMLEDMIWINELHYDNDGVDTNEGVEVAGLAGQLDLKNYELAFYSGANGKVYKTVPLSGTMDDEGCGIGAVWFPVTGVQNGPADAVALVRNGLETLEFWSYEGTFTALDGPAAGLTTEDMGPYEPASTPIGKSLQRVGTLDSGDPAKDFTWTGPADASPGTINSNQIVNCGGGGGQAKQFTGEVTNFIQIVGMEIVSNGIQLSIAYPTNFFDRIEIFSYDAGDGNPEFDGMESVWDLAEPGIVTSTNMTNFVHWTDTGQLGRGPVDENARRFYAAANADADADSDNLSDGQEIFIFKTDPNDNDADSDGLDDGEEVFYSYSSTNSERFLYHAKFNAVQVNTNDPADDDDGTERFDFHGGGRPLSLASNATDEGFVWIDGSVFDDPHSGGIFFNNDASNLYIGVAGLHVGGNNVLALFIDSNSGGVTNLRHLSTSVRPFGFSQATNIDFHATEFTPNVGLLLGNHAVDGKNDPNHNQGGGNDVGQGVYNLSDNSNFTNFNTTGGSALSQWGTNDLDGVSPHDGVEVALSLAGLECSPGDPIKVMAVFLGGGSGSHPNGRFVAGEAYGNSISGSGFNPVTLVGAEVELATTNTLPATTYPGFTDDDVMFQAFYWDTEPIEEWYDTVVTQVAELGQAGFTMAWLPVPYKADNPQFSMGYAPYDHFDLGEFDYRGQTPTRFGTKSELTNLIETLWATNIVPLCDIVLNHMAGSTNPPSFNTFTNYPHGLFQKTATDFHPSPEGYNDELQPYHNNYLFGGTNAHPLDVAFLTKNMRLRFKQWGSWLVTNIHYGGFRFDFTEGVEPWFLWEWLNYPAQRPLFGFAEYWKESSGEKMREWLDLTGRESAVYDWNLQLALEEMCEDDGTSFDVNRLKAPSLLGMEPEYTVTFVENHDTLQPSGPLASQNPTTPEHRGVAKEKELGYAYILHAQGLPLVFYRDYYLAPYYNVTNDTHFGTPLKPEIDRLMQIRKGTVAGGVQYLNTNANLFIQQRDGGTNKPGSILVLNDDPSSTLTNQVKTIYTNTVLIDLVVTNSPHSVTTDVNGVVFLSAPPRDYRVYGLTNSLSQ